MAIVWPTELDVETYAAAGRGVVVPRLACPGCREPMGFWGWYERDVRVSLGVTHRLWVRRARCGACDKTHACLPGFLAWGRLDPVEVIGVALGAMGGGVGARPVADRLGLGLVHTTVRDWRRRFARRAELLAVGFSRFCVALGDLAPRVSGEPEAVALAAIGAAWAAARRRFGDGVGPLWRFANAVVGGHLISTNTDLLWAAA